MSNPSPEILRKMRELAKKIAVANDLDESIRQKLLGHMEDRLLAYLSGNEPLSEKEAFIFVREHFGDPATVKSLMQQAHPREVQASLARRIGTLLITLPALQFVLYWVMQPIDRLFSDFGSSPSMNELYMLVRWLIFPLGLLLLIVLRWQRMIDAGRKPWFLKAPPRLFVIVYILLLALWILPAVLLHRSPLEVQAFPTPEWFSTGFAYFGMTLSCLLWIWWCSRPPRTITSMAAAAAAWLVYPLLQETSSLIGVFIGVFSQEGANLQDKVPAAAGVLLHAPGSLFWEALGKGPSVAAAAMVYLLFRLTLNEARPLTN